MNAWENRDRATAATVATGASVKTLFAHPYAGQPLNDRDCSDNPALGIVCTWGPYAGANPNSAIYEITLRKAAGGWYVAGLVVES